MVRHSTFVAFSRKHNMKLQQSFRFAPKSCTHHKLSIIPYRGFVFMFSICKPIHNANSMQNKVQALAWLHGEILSIGHNILYRIFIIIENEHRTSK